MSSREEEIQAAIAKSDRRLEEALSEKREALSDRRDALAEAKAEEKEAVAARHDARLLILEDRIRILSEDLKNEHQRLENERQRQHELLLAAASASAATAQMILPGLPSPRYESSVFVLCDSESRGQKPCGTCFAISDTFLLTCYHNLFEDANGNPEQNYTIALSVERDLRHSPLPVFPEGYYRVRLRYRNKSADWAILEVQGIRLQEFIPISLDPVPTDTDVKVFHCPVSLFNEQGEEILSPVAVWAKTVRGTAHHLRCNKGFCSGSSGAPMVLRNGFVVAFHQESYNEARLLPAGEELAEMTAEDAWDIVSDVVNSVATSYTAFGRGVQISTCPRLVQKLRELHIIQ